MSTQKQLTPVDGRSTLDGNTVGAWVAFKCGGSDLVTLQTDVVDSAGAWSLCSIDVLVSKSGLSWINPDSGATTITASGAKTVDQLTGCQLIMFRVSVANGSALPIKITAYGVAYK